MHEGHRQRMIERLKASEETLSEHELLEILLYNAIPRKNTNEIAHALLTTFGGLDGVLTADTEELLTVSGIGAETAAYLRCISLVMQKAKTSIKSENKMVFNVRDFVEFLREKFRFLTEEVIEIYCIDAMKVIRGSKRFTSRQATSASVAPEEIGRFIASRHPYGIVVAHNHVKTNCRPSEADNLFTAQIQMICSVHNVRLFDHVVIGDDGYYSYFISGELQRIRTLYSFHNIVGG